ncbi:MAG: BamA/TamA family outer membrane protein [Crocosphaera sp.]|nr:BamA/TamA family outer membrane protein [Crocosphaera sp.]
MEVSNQTKKLHFSPMLGIILTTTTVWFTDKPVRGQNAPSIASLNDLETSFELSDPLIPEASSQEVDAYPKVWNLQPRESKPQTSSESSSQPSQPQMALELNRPQISDPWLEESSNPIEYYPKVSTLQETPFNPEGQENSGTETISEPVILGSSSNPVEYYPKVSDIRETPSTSETLEDSDLETENKDTLSSLDAPSSESPLEKASAAESDLGQEIAQEATPEAQPDSSPAPEIEESPVVPIPEGIPTPEIETEEVESTGEEPRVLVVEVVVEGADPELENLVYNTVQTRPGRTATRSQLQEDVNAIYATGFFANVQVLPADTPLGVQITYKVELNPVLEQVVVSTVPDVEDQRVLPPETVQEIFGEQYGKTLNLRDLQDGIKQVNEWYAEQGFDLAQVIGSPEVSEDGIVTLIIAEGVIENIEVRFFDAEDESVDGRTRDFIVTREMQLQPGRVFNRRTAQFDLQRIFGLGLFEDVRISFSPGEDPREVIVNVDVVEGNTGSLAAGTGISSSSGLFGTVSYQEQNLGGNGQTLGGEVQLGERELLLDVSFTDPWIAGDPFRTAYTVNGFRRRTISLVFDGDDTSIRTFNGFDSPRVIRTGGGISFARPLADDPFTKPDWRFTAGVNYQRVQIENADGDIAPFSAPINGFDSQPLAFSDSGRDDLFTLTFAAAQDFRNNPLRPTSGHLIRLGVEQTLPVGSGSIAFTRLRGNYSYYIPVDFIDLGFIDEDQPKPQAFAFNVQAGTVIEDLPPYEAFVIGGSNSVRGYAEGELGNGRSYFQATAEYRFPIIPAVGAAIFFDYGSTIKSQRSVRGIPGVVRGLPSDGYGYGIGVRIQSPVGPIRVDYGVNDEGDSRIHFGIGERF